MLKNPFYKGKLNYKVENVHPALISHDDYEWVQALINSRGHRGASSPYHLLSGLIYYYCGKKYAIRYIGKDRVRRYCCQHKYEALYYCDSPLLNADSLEKVVEK